MTLKTRERRESVDKEVFSEVAEYRAELVRLTRERANKVALENAQRRRHLLPKEEVERAWAEIVATVRSHLLVMPSKLAPQCAAATTPEAAEKILSVAVDEALRELARFEERP